MVWNWSSRLAGFPVRNPPLQTTMAASEQHSARASVPRTFAILAQNGGVGCILQRNRKKRSRSRGWESMLKLPVECVVRNAIRGQ